METWIHETLGGAHSSPLVLAAVFLLGMISVFTCACNFSIIGVVAGYSGASGTTGRTRIELMRGLAFLAGTVLSMSLIGCLFGYAGNWVSSQLGHSWKIAAGLLTIVFGLYSLELFPLKLPGFSVRQEASRQNLFTAILFGIVVGGLSTACNSCCNPFFPVILAASFVNGSAAWGFLMLVVFALGFGLPLAAMTFGVGLGLGSLSKTLTNIVKVMKYAGGIALIAFGFYLLITY